MVLRVSFGTHALTVVLRAHTHRAYGSVESGTAQSACQRPARALPPTHPRLHSRSQQLALLSLGGTKLLLQGLTNASGKGVQWPAM